MTDHHVTMTCSYLDEHQCNVVCDSILEITKLEDRKLRFVCSLSNELAAIIAVVSRKQYEAVDLDYKFNIKVDDAEYQGCIVLEFKFSEDRSTVSTLIIADSIL